MERVPNHPYATYNVGYDAHGQYWIELGCAKCNPAGLVLYRKACSNPARSNYWIVMWAQQHLHRGEP
jgi:hypothetical protein